MPQAATAMPAHAMIGRGTASGPIIGGYATLNFGPFSLAVGDDVGTIGPKVAILMPCDFRIERVSWAKTAAGTANVDMMVSHNATLTVTADTDVLAAVMAIDGATGNYAEKASGGTTTLVEAARNVAKGRYLMVSFVVDATGVATDMSVQIHGFITSHGNVDSDND